MRRIDVLQADLLREGKLNIGGLVLLKKELEGEYKILVRDGEGEKEAKWDLPFPGLASQYPDNPKAKNARFLVKEVSLNKDLEIYLQGLNLKKIGVIKWK